MAEAREGGAQTFSISLDSLVTLQGLSHLTSYPIQAFTQKPLPLFPPFFLGAIKFPQLSCLAHWAWAVDTTRKEGVPVFQ